MLADGRVHHEARIAHPDSRATYDWHCACRPEEKHNHAAVEALLAQRLANRDKKVDGIWALVGRSRRVGLMRYEITDAEIQIHGPALWRLYVSWTQTAVGEDDSHRDVFTVDYADPANCLDGDAVLAIVEGRVAAAGLTRAKALRMAGEFVSP